MYIEPIKKILFDLQVIEDKINDKLDLDNKQTIWLYVLAESVTSNILKKGTIHIKYSIFIDRIFDNRVNIDRLIEITEDNCIGCVENIDDIEYFKPYLYELRNIAKAYKGILEGKKIIYV